MTATQEEWPGTGHIGTRIKYWRIKRNLSRKELAGESGVAASTIGDLENELQHSSTKTAQLAAALKINPQYLATGEGSPEHLVQQVPPRHDWPAEFPPVDVIKSLEPNERKLAGKLLLEAIEEIKAGRVKPRKRGQ